MPRVVLGGGAVSYERGNPVETQTDTVPHVSDSVEVPLYQEYDQEYDSILHPGPRDVCPEAGLSVPRRVYPEAGLCTGLPRI